MRTDAFTFQTDAQFRAFYRLTLAQVLFLESKGFSFNKSSARAMTKNLLDCGNGLTTAEMVGLLRKVAAEQIGTDGDPMKPDPMAVIMDAFNRLAAAPRAAR